MRQIAFLLLLLCAIINTYAQSRYILSGVFPNGQSVKENEVLFLNDSCVFNVTDQYGVAQQLKSCQWEFKALSRDEINYKTINKNEAESFKISIDSVLYRNWSLCYEFTRKAFENDNSIYYSALVCCKGELTSGEVVYLEKPVRLNLLPSKPILNVLSYEWSDYDSKNHFFEDGKMTLQIVADRCEKGFYSVRLTIAPGYLVSFDFSFNVDAINQIGSFEIEDSDAYLIFSAMNENGGVRSNDTIWLHTYIPTSTDNNPIEETISFFPNPVKDVLCINGNIENIISIEMINFAGQIVKQVDYATPCIDVSDLANGIYFLSYIERNTQKRKTFKFLKTQ